jgi:hypothetical protein
MNTFCGQNLECSNINADGKAKVITVLKWLNTTWLRRIGEWWYSSTIGRGEWSASRPCRFIPGESPRNPLGRRMGRSRSRCRRYGEKKNRVPAGNRTASVQPLASQYTDWAGPAFIKAGGTYSYPRCRAYSQNTWFALPQVRNLPNKSQHDLLYRSRLLTALTRPATVLPQVPQMGSHPRPLGNRP